MDVCDAIAWGFAKGMQKVKHHIPWIDRTRVEIRVNENVQDLIGHVCQVSFAFYCAFILSVIWDFRTLLAVLTWVDIVWDMAFVLPVTIYLLGGIPSKIATIWCVAAFIICNAGAAACAFGLAVETNPYERYILKIFSACWAVTAYIFIGIAICGNVFEALFLQQRARNDTGNAEVELPTENILS